MQEHTGVLRGLFVRQQFKSPGTDSGRLQITRRLGEVHQRAKTLASRRGLATNLFRIVYYQASASSTMMSMTLRVFPWTISGAGFCGSEGT